MIEPYWQDKEIVIYNNDCLNVLDEMSAESVELIITDPPYGVNFSGSKYYEDSLDYVKRNIGKWLQEMNRVLKMGCHLYIFIPTLQVDMWVNSIKRVFEFNNLIATQVYVNNRYNNNNFGWDLQLIVYASKGKPKRFNAVNWIPASESWVTDKRNIKPKEWTYKYPSFISNNIIRANYKNNRVRKRTHPNEKNDMLIAKFIEMSSNKGDTVLDPFMGCGSTMIACKKTERKGIGIELKEKYCRVANRRLGEILL